jgi:hypothetical protein
MPRNGDQSFGCSLSIVPTVTPTAKSARAHRSITELQNRRALAGTGVPAKTARLPSMDRTPSKTKAALDGGMARANADRGDRRLRGNARAQRVPTDGDALATRLHNMCGVVIWITQAAVGVAGYSQLRGYGDWRRAGIFCCTNGGFFV